MKQDLFIALYIEKGPLIMNYLIKIGCPKEDAEDIVQETFIKAIAYMVHLEEANVSAWLFKVALNKYYDSCRKNKRYPQIDIDERHFMEVFVDKETGEKIMLAKEHSHHVQEVLEVLTPLYKNLLLMKYELGLSYGQIGELVDMKEDKVKTYLYRARQSFKKGWEETTYGK